MTRRQRKLETVADVSIAKLRRDHPGWAWTAEHGPGFCWQYVGLRAGKRVRVYATASFCGPREDDYATVWRVDDGATSETYFYWAMKLDPPPEPPASSADERLAEARVRRALRLVPRPLAYCRPDNDQGRRR